MNEVLPYVFPGTMVLWLYFIAQTPLSEIITEQREGKLARLMTTPLPLHQYIVAKMVRAYLLCLFAQLLMVVGGMVLFQADLGNPVLLLGVGMVATFAVIGPIALIYAVCKNEQQVNAIAPVLILTVGLLGGSMFPVENMPGMMQQLALLTPNRWVILSYQAVIIDDPLQTLLMPTLVLLAIGGVFSGLAMVRFRKRLQQGDLK